jgi:hypothetical protein
MPRDVILTCEGDYESSENMNGINLHHVSEVPWFRCRDSGLSVNGMALATCNGSMLGIYMVGSRTDWSCILMGWHMQIGAAVCFCENLIKTLFEGLVLVAA